MGAHSVTGASLPVVTTLLQSSIHHPSSFIRPSFPVNQNSQPTGRLHPGGSSHSKFVPVLLLHVNSEVVNIFSKSETETSLYPCVLSFGHILFFIYIFVLSGQSLLLLLLFTPSSSSKLLLPPCHCCRRRPSSASLSPTGFVWAPVPLCGMDFLMPWGMLVHGSSLFWFSIPCFSANIFQCYTLTFVCSDQGHLFEWTHTPPHWRGGWLGF